MKATSSQETMAEYLRDESRVTGRSDKIFFPETEEDVITILEAHPHAPITIQGARTGVTGGCVPQSGLTVNMERMNRVLCLTHTKGGGTITVEPGIRLQALRSYIRPHGLFFPPDPTEATASLGGMVSCNSSGARSFRYGSVRDYILGLDLILASGRKLHLTRSTAYADNRSFQLASPDGSVIVGSLPELQMPHVQKHTAGYYVQPDMDLLDLFIGAEGTLGIITSITLQLLPQNAYTWAGVIFLPSEPAALKLVRMLRGDTGQRPCLAPEALEYFGQDTLQMLRQAQLAGEALTDMELIRENACCGLYVEYAGNDRKQMEQAFEDTCLLAEAAGADPYRAWAAINSHHMEKLRSFRHAAPECINTKISQIQKSCPGVTKMGTDMSVPDPYLEGVFSMYRRGLAEEGLDSAIFGHIGNNHLHVNVLPKSMDEFHQAKALFSRWAEKIVAMGGSVSSEHGIGKLKTGLLKQLYSDQQIASMRELKKCFDPKQILNQGNIFEYEP